MLVGSICKRPPCRPSAPRSAACPGRARVSALEQRQPCVRTVFGWSRKPTERVCVKHGRTYMCHAEGVHRSQRAGRASARGRMRRRRSVPAVELRTFVIGTASWTLHLVANGSQHRTQLMYPGFTKIWPGFFLPPRPHAHTWTSSYACSVLGVGIAHRTEKPWTDGLLTRAYAGTCAQRTPSLSPGPESQPPQSNAAGTIDAATSLH